MDKEYERYLKKRDDLIKIHEDRAADAQERFSKVLARLDAEEQERVQRDSVG